MITEVVHSDLPKGISREGLLAKYRQTAPAWSNNEDLVRKLYFFDESQSLGGCVYVGKTKEAAIRWHGREYQTRINELYGTEPRMAYYDTLVVVDNISNNVSEPSP